MALNKTALENSLRDKLKENFEKGKEECWSIEKASGEMAKVLAEAIHEYISQGEIKGIVTEVKDPDGTAVIGKGQQTGAVKIS